MNKRFMDFLPRYLPNANHEALDQLNEFLFMLRKWNKTYNLTTITTTQAMVIRHVLDSLAADTYIKGDNIADIGSGAGLPGIPLAIMNPETQFFLVDNNNKKTRFLKQAVMSLQLDNAEVIHQRAEDFSVPVAMDTVVCRAFGNLAEFAQKSQHLTHSDSLYIALKGVYPLLELELIPDEFVVKNIHAVEVEDLNAERHIVEMVNAK